MCYAFVIWWVCVCTAFPSKLSDDNQSKSQLEMAKNKTRLYMRATNAKIIMIAFARQRIGSIFSLCFSGRIKMKFAFFRIQPKRKRWMHRWSKRNTKRVIRASSISRAADKRNMTILLRYLPGHALYKI